MFILLSLPIYYLLSIVPSGLMFSKKIYDKTTTESLFFSFKLLIMYLNNSPNSLAISKQIVQAEIKFKELLKQDAEFDVLKEIVLEIKKLKQQLNKQLMTEADQLRQA